MSDFLDDDAELNNRFRVASGNVTYDKFGGRYRDLQVTNNPWLKELQNRGELNWEMAAEIEEGLMRQAPHAVPIGELEFSTSQALVAWPSIVWDVNAYYAHLGVSWQATKREIKDAYFERKGYRSDRLTYVVKQLLDDSVRRQYDGCRQGSVFFDRYVAEYVRHQVMLDQRRQHGRSLTAEEQEAEGLEALDLSRFEGKEVRFNETDLGARHSPVVGSKWKWGYYLWKTGSYDIDKLAAWQNALCVAFGRESRRLAVGLMGGDEEAQVVRVGYHSVAFINVNADPTPILARTLFQTDHSEDSEEI